MSTRAVAVEGLGKRYRIGAAAVRHDSLRYAIAHALTSPVRNFRRLRSFRRFGEQDDATTLWALRDVAFEVDQGEVLGIIGHNGAGKSTLLKVLSRITRPTVGSVGVRGRVGSLLEVGTGFHPELTGRDNIYLNGSILGMDRAYIGRRFDEIVDFAGVERFVDTPVKRYSSGMYVRLAFAVAAHLETEVLVIDEVLAVGDADFRRRCLGKMESVAATGRTVLFVSHDLATIQRLCRRTLLLESGQLVADGETEAVISRYLASESGDAGEVELSESPRRQGLGEQVRIVESMLLNAAGEATRQLRFGEPFAVSVTVQLRRWIADASLLVRIDSIRGHSVTTASSEAEGVLVSGGRDDRISLSARFSSFRLTPGLYWVTLGVRSGRQGLDEVVRAFRFEVTEQTYRDTGPHNGTWGDIETPVEWQARSILPAAQRA